MTTAEQELCKREDLRIVLNIPSYWGVNDDGSLGDENFGEGDADICNFDSYSCDSCGEFFTKDDDNDDAWKKAVDHLAAGEAAA